MCSTLKDRFLICPAYAGMIPEEELVLPVVQNLSRVCGDDPNGTATIEAGELFVPRMRG